MSPHQSIAHYRVTTKLGEGGMGSVYRATDTKLNRDVAIKILPDAFAADPDRMARFSREAQVLAALNHPNIAQIYGVEERALVMELVDGAGLDQRIAAGPIPMDDAIPIARQIAEALEYAHERGIVHRDLKPANIKITADGRVKVLDFGLAKAMSSDTVAPADSINSPTLTMRATMAGMILGTASYMAPEQAKGKPVDRRADIWAFGVVLLEMLTGHQMYSGETVSETLAAVIMKEPDLSVLPANTPAPMRSLLRRYLDRDPLRRLRDIGEARVVLERPVAEEQPAVAAAVPVARPSRLPWIAAATLAIAAALIATIHFRESAPPLQLMHFSMLPPEKEDFGRWLALSPNGRLLAFTGRNGGGIGVRAIDSTQSRILPGTEGVNTVFWSPDSRFLAFSNQGRLKKADVQGGPPETLCDLSAVLLGGTWNRDNVILFGATASPIMRVSASGGTPTPMTEGQPGQTQHICPVFLPDGRHFLYLRGSAGIYAGSLDAKPAENGRQRVLPAGGLSFAYAPPRAGIAGPGHILFMRDGVLMAQAFEEKSMQSSGDAAPVAESIATSLSLAAFSVSDNGLLAYRTGSGDFESVRYTWFDRTGRETGVAATSNLGFMSLSADETRLAHAQTSTGSMPQIWILDLVRGVDERFSFAPDGGNSPVWSPDGQWVAFNASIQGSTAIYLKDAGKGNSERLLLRSPESKHVQDWSRDGRFLVYVSSSLQTGRMEVLAIADPLTEGEHKPITIVASPQFNHSSAQVSPDSRWMAWVSGESGKGEVYVRPFPPSDGRSGQWQVSTAGGGMPRWRADGKELFYIAADSKLMAVDITTGTAFQSGVPHALFVTPIVPTMGVFRYAVTRDGKRFLMAVPAVQTAQPPVHIVVNWEAGLRK